MRLACRANVPLAFFHPFDASFQELGLGMAVLVEAISVVVRLDAINEKYPGGWDRFVTTVPNATLCFDDNIARVGFMNPQDSQDFIDTLWQNGLEWINNTGGQGKAQDFVVVDQQKGALDPCEWLAIETVPYGSGGGAIAACRFVTDSDSLGDQGHLSAADVRTPSGWAHEGSISARYIYEPSPHSPQRLRFLRQEGPLDVFVEEDTGEERLSARPAHPNRQIYEPGKPVRIEKHRSEPYPDDRSPRGFSRSIHISAAVAALIAGAIGYFGIGDALIESLVVTALSYFLYLPLFWYFSVWCARIKRVLEVRLW